MNLEIGLTQDEFTNTHFASLAVLLAHYQQNHQLKPLENVQVEMRTRDFSPVEKLIQVLISILAGCQTLFEFTMTMRGEQPLALSLGWERFADQSTLSRTLDELTLKQIEQLRHSGTEIWRSQSQVMQRDWHKYLWLDFDLTGLPCGPLAEASQKGYFGEKKPVDAS